MSMATDARIGSELAGYRIEAPIGRGGMGVVYRAEQLRLGRKVALKLLAPELAENQGFRARFEHESRLAAALDHPNIVPLFEAGEADGLLFISMRYVEGTDLRALLSRARPPRARARARDRRARSAARSTRRTMRGLVHRDVKPGNILIASDAAPDLPEHCYLTDFGLTKDTSSPVELTATGTFVGTIDYIAPEQIEGAKPDGRGDQYALACVLFECLTGHPPFPRDEEIGVMWAHLQDEPPTVTADRARSCPPAIDAVIAQALAKAPQGALRDLLGDGRGRPRRAAARRARRRPAAVTRAHASPCRARRRHPRQRGQRRTAAGRARARAGSAAARGRAAPAADGARGRARAPRRAAAPSRPRIGPLHRRASSALMAVVVAVAGYLAGQSGGDERARSQQGRDATTTSPWPTTRTGRRAASPTPSAGLELVAPITLQSGKRAHRRGQDRPSGAGAAAGRRRRAARDRRRSRSIARRPCATPDLPAGAGASATVFVVSTEAGPRPSPASGAGTEAAARPWPRRCG